MFLFQCRLAQPGRLKGYCLDWERACVQAERIIVFGSEAHRNILCLASGGLQCATLIDDPGAFGDLEGHPPLSFLTSFLIPLGPLGPRREGGGRDGKSHESESSFRNEYPTGDETPTGDAWSTRVQ